MNEIVINHLSYNYYNRVGNKSTTALENVNLSFGRGMRVVICGKNGAGKSTLLSIIAGKKVGPFCSSAKRGCRNGIAARA